MGSTGYGLVKIMTLHLVNGVILKGNATSKGVAPEIAFLQQWQILFHYSLVSLMWAFILSLSTQI